MKLLLYIIFAIIIIHPAFTFAQDEQKETKPDYIYYESDEYLCRFNAPIGWKFDIDNARLDNYSAALFPDTSEYYNSGLIIYIWIFGTKEYSYEKFITADSLAYLKENPKIVFKKTDSVLTESKQSVLYYETADPGGLYDLCFVGYIPAGDEIIVYQMDITDRLYYPEANHFFRVALSGFSLVEKEE